VELCEGEAGAKGILETSDPDMPPEGKEKLKLDCGEVAKGFEVADAGDPEDSPDPNVNDGYDPAVVNGLTTGDTAEAICGAAGKSTELSSATSSLAPPWECMVLVAELDFVYKYIVVAVHISYMVYHIPYI